MKVLISAYACEPHMGSEHGIGWNWAVQAARKHEVWVLTRGDNPEKIQAELESNPQPNLHFLFHDLPGWAKFLTRNSVGIQLYYLLWQLTAINVVKTQHRKIEFDLVHHVTYGTIRFPSPLAWLNVPFIWGPVAGGEEAPRGLVSTFSLRARLWEELRLLNNRLSQWDPFVRYTTSKASAIVAVTDDTRKRLRESDRGKAHVIPAMGLDDPGSDALGNSVQIDRFISGDGPLQMIYVGRLLDWKGVHLGIDAMASARSRGVLVELTIVGDGPSRMRLENQAKALGLQGVISFKGNIPRAEALVLVDQSDVMMFPSMHDSGGFAVLEAMQASLPVICLDLGGPAVSVTRETGFKISAVNNEQVISDLADAIETLAKDSGLRRRMGAAGRERVESMFTWSRKGDEIHELYQQVLNAQA